MTNQTLPNMCTGSDHPNYGEALICPVDPTHEVVCGEFYHACRVCNPQSFTPCLYCLRERAFCAC